MLMSACLRSSSAGVASKPTISFILAYVNERSLGQCLPRPDCSDIASRGCARGFLQHIL